MFLFFVIIIFSSFRLTSEIPSILISDFLNAFSSSSSLSSPFRVFVFKDPTTNVDFLFLLDRFLLTFFISVLTFFIAVFLSFEGYWPYSLSPPVLSE